MRVQEDFYRPSFDEDIDEEDLKDPEIYLLNQTMSMGERSRSLDNSQDERDLVNQSMISSNSHLTSYQ